MKKFYVRLIGKFEMTGLVEAEDAAEALWKLEEGEGLDIIHEVSSHDKYEQYDFSEVIDDPDGAEDGRS